MSSKLLRPFSRKINDLYSSFILSTQSDRSPFYCGICCQEFKGGYAHHIQREEHCNAGNDIAERLISVFFSPGIVLMNKTKNGFCIFCDTALPNFFSDLIRHLNDSNHQEQVKAYKKKYEECKFNAIYEACRVSADDDENNLLKKIADNGMAVENGKFVCIPCDFDILDEKQFCTHIADINHLYWAIKQLCAAADMIEFHRGVIIRNDGFFCLLCKNVIGSGLLGAEKLSAHISACENTPFKDLTYSSSDKKEGSPLSDDYEYIEISDRSSSSGDSPYVIIISSEENSSSSADEEDASPTEDCKYTETLKEGVSSSEDSCKFIETTDKDTIK